MVTFKFTTKLLLIKIFLISNLKPLFFDLKKNTETCFAEELNEESIAIIQFKLMKVFAKTISSNNGYYKFHIRSTSDDKSNNKEFIANQIEGKIYYIVPKSDIYEICVIGLNESIIYDSSNNIAKLSISIDSNDSIGNLSHSDLPQNTDLQIVEERIQTVQGKISNVSKHQKRSIKLEEEFAHFQTHNSRILLIMSICQISIILLIFLYFTLYLRKQIKLLLTNSL